MTGAPVPRIDISYLQHTGQLGGGGQGKVTGVSGLQIGGKWPAALKIYATALSRHVDMAVLERIVAFPRLLSLADGDWLEENTAWPAMIAEDRGVARGFLMRMIPEAFYFAFKTPSGTSLRKPAETAFLLNSDDYVAQSGLAVSDRDRLALLASVASALTRLHGLGVAVGDLSPKNLLFSLHPAASCFIIDCDAMCVRGESVTQQIQTPDWEVPSGEATATPAADTYKFALLAIRLFARDQSSHDRTPLAAVAPDLGHLAQASLRSDPSQRPSPAEWIPALTAAASTAAPAPARVTVPATAPPVFSVPIETVTSTASPHRQQRPIPPAPRPHGRRIAVTLAAIAAGIAIVVVVIVSGLHSSASPGSSGTGATSATSGNSSDAQQEASQINNLLNSSAASRQSLATAVQNVGNCTNVSSAISAISAVASQRTSEYNQASGLPTQALPNGTQLKSDLLSALHYSALADRDYLIWAQQNASCQGTVPANASFNNGNTSSANAVTAKQAFVQLWNPVASSDGFPARSQGDI